MGINSEALRAAEWQAKTPEDMTVSGAIDVDIKNKVREQEEVHYAKLS